jgi:hypothetical protein
LRRAAHAPGTERGGKAFLRIDQILE